MRDVVTERSWVVGETTAHEPSGVTGAKSREVVLHQRDVGRFEREPIQRREPPEVDRRERDVRVLRVLSDEIDRAAPRAHTPGDLHEQRHELARFSLLEDAEQGFVTRVDRRPHARILTRVSA